MSCPTCRACGLPLTVNGAVMFRKNPACDRRSVAEWSPTKGLAEFPALEKLAGAPAGFYGVDRGAVGRLGPTTEESAREAHAEAASMADELNETLNAVLDERDALRARLDAIRAAWRAHDAARSTYLEAWGTAEACETEAERAYYETSQALAALMREP